MAFPTNPSPGDSYTDGYGTVWVYAGTVNGWYRQSVSTPNDTSYTAAISGPAGSNTQVQFNDNGELAGDSGLTYNKTTDALSGGAFIPTGSTVPTNGLYLPSANNVAISTNGTGRISINADGDVDIDSGGVFYDASTNRLAVGTTSPADTFQINKNATSAASGGLTLKTADSNESLLSIGVSTSLDTAFISSLQNGTGTARPISFVVGSSSTNERMRIDTSGRLLVGTSTSVSTYNLEVVNDSSLNLALLTGNNSLTSGPFLTLRRSRGSTASPTVVSSGDVTGVVDFRGYSGAASAYLQCATIAAAIDGEPDTAGDTTDMPGRLVFSTTADGASSPTERMRIRSDGTVIINDTGTGAATRLQVSADLASYNGVVLKNTVAQGSGQNFILFLNSAGNTAGAIVHNGTATVNYSTSSDYRLKENVVPVDDGISRLQQLKPSRFNFIDDPDKTVDGFLAHEVQDIVPEAITGEKDALNEDGSIKPQGIDQSKLVPLLTAALQEAVARIESLEARLTAAGI